MCGTTQVSLGDEYPDIIGNSRDGFTVKYSTSGNVQWALQWGTEGRDIYAEGLDVGSTGVYSTGISKSGSESSGFIHRVKHDGTESFSSRVSDTTFYQVKL